MTLPLINKKVTGTVNHSSPVQLDRVILGYWKGAKIAQNSDPEPSELGLRPREWTRGGLH